MPQFGIAHLFRRQLLADRAATLTVVVVVALVGFLLAAWPRVIDGMFTEELRERVTEHASGQVDLPVPDSLRDSEQLSVDDVYGQLDRRLHRIGENAPPHVRSILDQPRYVTLSNPREILEHIPAELRAANVTMVADPGYIDEVRVVEGELPGGLEIDEAADVDELAGADSPNAVSCAAEKAAGQEDANVDLRPRIVEVALSVDTAARLDWPIGQRRDLCPDGRDFHPPLIAHLSGTFEASDSESAYWKQNPSVLVPFEERDPNAGTTIFGRAFVAPEVMPFVASHVDMFVWYPVDGSALSASDGPVLADELRTFTATSYDVGMDLEGNEPLRLGSRAIATVDAAIARQHSATALLAVVAAGPFGVALALAALGSKLVVERRRRAMSLIAARGASAGQVRIVLTVEGALLGLPTAVLALVVAEYFTTGDGGAAGVLLPLAIGMAPAALLPMLARPGRLRTERADLSHTRWHWVRDIADLLVVAVAVTSVVVVRQRRLTDLPDAGFDPLLAASPLLVALAAAVVVLRLYSIPMVVLERALKRRQGVVGFVGTVRAVRDPAGGVAPILALVVGMSMLIFSTVLWTTTNSGGVSSSITEVGADLRADGAVFSADEAEAVAQLPDVAAAATVARQGRSAVVVGNHRVYAEIFVADTARLAEVQEGLSDVAQTPTALKRAEGDVIPVMVSAGLADLGAVVSIADLHDLEVDVVETAPMVAGLTTSRPWVLIDAAVAEENDVRNIRSARSLFMASTGDMPIEVERVAEILDQQVQFSAPSDVLAEVRAGAVGAGLIGSFVVAIVVVGVMSAAAVVLMLMVGAPGRGRLLSQLRTLGLSARQARGLAWWEIAPTAATAVAVGCALGLGVPWLVFGTVDLRPLTGADHQPPIIVDWMLVGTAVVVFVLIVALAVAVAVASSRRLRLGTVLRVGEDV